MSTTSNEEESCQEESQGEDSGWITPSTSVSHATSHFSLSRSIKVKEQQVEVLHMMHQLSCSRMEAQAFHAQRDKLSRECHRLEGLLVEQEEYISRLELEKELIQADASTAASTCYYCSNPSTEEDSSSAITSTVTRNVCTQTEDQKSKTQFVAIHDAGIEKHRVSYHPKQSIGRRLLCLSGTSSTCPAACIAPMNKDTTPIKTNCSNNTPSSSNRTAVDISIMADTPISLLQHESRLYLEEELNRMQETYQLAKESHFGEMRHKDIQIAYLRQELAKQKQRNGRTLLSI